MSPGAACGDPRAAPGYLEASRRAPEVPPGCRGKRSLYSAWPPQTPTTYRLVAVGFRALGVAGVVFRALGVAGVVFGGQQAGPKVLRGGCV